jgi:hypothetical protein
MPARLRFTLAPAVRAALVPAALVLGAWLLLLLVGRRAMWESEWLAHSAVVSASTCVLLVVTAFLIALPRVLRLPAAGALVGASVGLAMVDLVAWRHYHDVLSIGDWQSFSSLPLIGPSVESHLKASDLTLLIPLGLAALALRWHTIHPDRITVGRRLRDLPRRQARPPDRPLGPRRRPYAYSSSSGSMSVAGLRRALRGPGR